MNKYQNLNLSQFDCGNLTVRWSHRQVLEKKHRRFPRIWMRQFRYDWPSDWLGMRVKSIEISFPEVPVPNRWSRVTRASGKRVERKKRLPYDDDKSVKPTKNAL